ncbi:myb family transcription factor PHL5 [Gossypium australe]|uniref:Myb family transcription factor PHL5 n=1 Tax=Gossypium australe TaxID=47621 RepID=A0A5B6UBN9_9ROSI|nr:myb family transcription factor PHL5 [Gossypium australe]
MNTKRTDCQELARQSLGFNRNCNLQPAMEGVPQQLNPGSSSSNPIMSGFHTPAYAFYATERRIQLDTSSFCPQHNIYSSIESIAQDEPNYDFRNTLQSLVKSQICSDQYQKSFERSYKFPGSNAKTHFSFPSRGNQDQRAYCKKSNKTRIRWTQDLHEKFVECVKRLGGCEKATPKTILKLMDTQEIPYCKIHARIYTSGLHLTEALQLQLDVQRSLNEQLEFQRNLQLRIEEQGRRLKMMIDEQQKTNESLLKNQGVDIKPYEHDPSFRDLDSSIAETSENVLTSGPC